MRINFLVNPVFNGWEPTDTRLGGTEEAVVKWAEDLASRGEKVAVYRNSYMSNYLHNEVMYVRRERYGDKYVPPADICINVKSSEINPIEPTIYFTNETNASRLDLSLFKGVIWPSQWAKDNIPVNNNKVFVVPHGYDPEQIYPGRKTHKQCFYASSPDRGLETLLKVWPEVYEAHPDATLILTYGAQGKGEGIINLGNVNEETMNEIYRTSDVWCHPCNGGELYCITGVKAQASGCIPVVIPKMALKETVIDGYKATKKTYASTLTAALSRRDFPEIRENLKNHHFPTYKDSTDQLLKVIEAVV